MIFFTTNGTPDFRFLKVIETPTFNMIKLLTFNTVSPKRVEKCPTAALQRRDGSMAGCFSEGLCSMVDVLQ